MLHTYSNKQYSYRTEPNLQTKNITTQKRKLLHWQGILTPNKRYSISDPYTQKIYNNAICLTVVHNLLQPRDINGVWIDLSLTMSTRVTKVVTLKPKWPKIEAEGREREWGSWGGGLLPRPTS